MLDTGTGNKEPDLDFYYKTIDCRCIDIVTREIGGKSYSVVCDDEGLFVEQPVVTGYFGSPTCIFSEAFYGNILICGLSDENGNLTGLSDEELVELKKHIVFGRLVRTHQKSLLCQLMVFDPL